MICLATCQRMRYLVYNKYACIRLESDKYKYGVNECCITACIPNRSFTCVLAVRYISFSVGYVYVYWPLRVNEN